MSGCQPPFKWLPLPAAPPLASPPRLQSPPREPRHLIALTSSTRRMLALIFALSLVRVSLSLVGRERVPVTGSGMCTALEGSG